MVDSDLAFHPIEQLGGDALETRGGAQATLSYTLGVYQDEVSRDSKICWVSVTKVIRR